LASSNGISFPAALTGTPAPLISVFRLTKADNALMVLLFTDPDGKISNFRFLPNREYQ
jgi:hypothetical protein